MVTDLTRLSDGTYGRELGRVSPEGNIYGTTRWVRDVLRNFWWNGARWLEIGEDIGQSNTVQLLPTTPQEPDTVWRCLDRYEEGKYIWKYFFWDAESQSWQPILWYWTVDSYQELPNNPWFRGQAHEVKEPDVLAMWDGYTWRRIRISSLEDDIGIVSTLETYGGTLQGLSPEVELIYISPVELTLKPINSDFEYVTVNSIVIDSSKRTSVYSFSPVLDWWDETESFSMSLLQHSTNENSEEYWVYLANKDSCFNLSTYDFRGRLFCSKTTPNNNRLGKFGSDAYNAVLIGRCQTAVPDDPSDRVEFLYELDVSLVSRAADLKETFREFSDFDLVYVDENTLRLDRIYGTMGQIFIAGSLYYLGESIDLTNSDVRIIVDGNGLLEFDDSEIATDTIYYVYIASNSDIFNDNEINPATSMPWHPEDDGAGNGVDGPYYANKDLRLKLFLSTKPPEEGRLAETWRAYWTRHIGHIRTDGAGKFIFSSSISSIRQATLSPSYFDGMADIDIIKTDDTTLAVCKKAATGGILMVGSKSVETFAINDPNFPNSHKVSLTSNVYSYLRASETLLTNNLLPASSYSGAQVHLYMANSSFGGQNLSNSLFFCNIPHENYYLSNNYPGNNARWLATIGIEAASTTNNLLQNTSFLNTSYWSILYAENVSTAYWYLKPMSSKVYNNAYSNEPLFQNISGLDTTKTYMVGVRVDEIQRGNIKLRLGGAETPTIDRVGYFTFYVRPITSSGFSIVPSSFFGAISSPSCEQVVNSRLQGNFLIDSIAPIEVTIEDNYSSISSVFSSAKVMALYNELSLKIGSYNLLTAQRSNGIDIYFAKYTTNQGRILPQSASIDVAFADTTTRTIDGQGITTPQISGLSHHAFVWFSHNNCLVNTNEPSLESPSLFELNNYILAAYLYNPNNNTSTAYATPQAISEYTNGYRFYATSTLSDNPSISRYTPPWKAFNQTNTGVYDAWFSAKVPYFYYIDYVKGGPQCLYVDMGAGNEKAITHYAIERNIKGTHNPLIWSFYGSNNGGSWTELDFRQDIFIGSPLWSPFFYISNTTKYRFYMLKVFYSGSNSSSNGVSIANLKLVDLFSDPQFSKYRDLLFPITQFDRGYNGADNLSIEYATPAMGAHTYGNVVVSATSEHNSRYPAWKAFNRETNEPHHFWLSSEVPSYGSPQSLMVDFFTPTIINKYCLQDIANPASYIRNWSPSEWSLQGSNDARVSVSSDNYWSTLHSISNAPALDFGRWSQWYTFINNTPYRFYRLRISYGRGKVVGLANLRLVASL